ncbi:hypothetical protein BKA67DRAFT_664322 [Truncatella angustata]|uniref:DUF7892 domain-containing protein n=1 Tax=Truncatella angustata TaxID=152316 RepID=A0A9P8RLY5_9PEZI|nr:uncharacterized protein BKA67DRAFT_664322 [Truncatella angustata]KAH6646486.1 hypothetical protein BKA67DRAFT_664322 [Truncatella angustata]KAH8199036.1 hypothetical protein TruAng_006774 [Truncatella angustata]
MRQGQPPPGSVSTRPIHKGTYAAQPTRLAEEQDVIIFDESSDTDVSMSASDVESHDTEGQKCSARLATGIERDGIPDSSLPLGFRNENGRKRKLSADQPATLTDSDPPKKAKLNGNRPAVPNHADSITSDKSLLPAEIWHHIFTLTQPQGLGNSLQVSKLFNLYLDPSSSKQSPQPRPPIRGHLSTLQPNEIWRASRKRYWPKMPAPLEDKTELEMWRLVHMRRCQYCGKEERGDSPAVKSMLSPGPGVGRVRMLWPFAVICCGSCLIANTTKEIDLLLSPSIPHLLFPALPFVLITSDIQAFTPGALTKGLSLGDAALTKIFFTKQIDELRDEFVSVKNLGPGAAEEWLKGLEDRGKERRLDAERWEKWDLGGGLRQLWQSHTPGAQPVAMPSTLESSRQVENNSIADRSTIANHKVNTLGMTVKSTTASKMQPIPPLRIEESEPFSQSQSMIQSTQSGPTQSKRTIHEVIELRAARRAEIERRAMLLQPPLQPDVLAQIPSFQAALQIITPLDDNAWEMLKRRLLLQRADVKNRRERDQVAAMPLVAVEEPAEEQHVFERQGKEIKELTDKDWDDAQAPLRAQISMYADEIIRDAWDDGNNVNKESSPRFAVEVLLYVRRKFYAKIERDAAASRGTHKEPKRDPPQGPFTQKLTLENLKWLFEVKVKPHTETHRKELFLCNGCDDSLKAYGFEGVVQHYAAKHTNSMSVGSIVVYWRSEWPEVPPFHPDPVARTAQHRKPTTSPVYQSAGPMQQHNHHHQAPTSFGVSMAPHVGHPYYGQYNQPDSHYQHSGFAPSTMYATTQASYTPAFLEHLPYNQGYGIASSTGASLPVPQPVTNYSQQFAHGLPFPVPAVHNSHTYDAYQLTGQAGYLGFPGGSQSDRIRTQLEALACFSREVWMATAGVKELPGYIRVYVCFYHLAKRYRSHFAEDPPLGMFIDGLSNHKEMRPVRNVNGLQCKACHLHLGGCAPVENERSVFSLPQLVNHFQKKHVEPAQGMTQPILNWIADMVFLPDVACLSHLRAMVGMDSHKYGLMTEAFPQVTFSGPFGAEGSHGQTAPSHQNHLPGHHGVHSLAHSAENSSAAVPDGYMPMHVAFGQQQASEDRPLPHPQSMVSGEGPLVNEFSNYFSQANVVANDDGQVFPQHLLHQPGPSDVGRGTPDRAAGKHRNRKSSAKERRAGQGGKSRKGSAKHGVRQGKPAAEKSESGEDKEAEAEAQRQEEAIRAMWAADRQTAARIASDPEPPQTTRPESPTDGPPSAMRPQAVQVSPPPLNHVARPIAGPDISRNPPVVVLDHEDDLFAGLEHHLDQQRVLKPTNIAVSSRRPISEQAPVQNSRASDGLTQSSVHERCRSRSPDRAGLGEAPSQHGYVYRNRGPPAYDTNPAYARVDDPTEVAQSLAGDRDSLRAHVDNHSRVAPQVHEAVYTDDPRPRPASSFQYVDSSSMSQAVRSAQAQAQISYTEVWERVLVRDSRGDEYYIERPIRREPAPVYVRYEDEQPRYREATTTYRGQERNVYRRESVCESAYQQDTTGNRQMMRGAMSSRPESPRRQLVYEEAPSATAVSFEEYDPKFPSAPSSLGPPRYVHY